MNTPDTHEMSKRMRKMSRKAYVEARVGIARRTASRPEIDVGGKRGMIAAGATGIAAGAATMVLGKAARRRMQEEDAAVPDTGPQHYKVSPPSRNGRGAAPEAPVSDSSVAAGS